DGLWGLWTSAGSEQSGGPGRGEELGGRLVGLLREGGGLAGFPGHPRLRNDLPELGSVGWALPCWELGWLAEGGGQARFAAGQDDRGERRLRYRGRHLEPRPSWPESMHPYRL